MHYLIGLTGENGSGKGTFAESLIAIAEEAGYTTDRIRSSDVLKQTMKIWDIPFSRENFQQLALLMDSTYGEGTLTHAVQTRITQSPADIIIFDGVRWKSDEALIRSFPANLLVYVTADAHLRYTRMRARKEKVGEDIMPLSQFLEEEVAPTEKDIPTIGAHADVTLRNDGPVTVLQHETEDVWKTHIAPRLSK